MENAVQIRLGPDSMSATLAILSPKASEEDVAQELAANGVTTGIQWDVIRDALKKSQITGLTQGNICAAQTGLWQFTLELCGRAFDHTAQGIQGLKQLYGAIAEAIAKLVAQKPGDSAPEGVFLKQGEVFCFEKYTAPATDVLGKPLTTKQVPTPALSCGQTIRISAFQGRIDYLALQSGYLVFSQTGVFDIVNPTFASSNAMTLYFMLIPVRHGKPELLETLYSFANATVQDVSTSVPIPDKAQISAILEGGKTSFAAVKKGDAAKMPVDATMEIIAKANKIPTANKDGSIDLREMSPYPEITIGSIIAEKKPPIAGAPGKTVLGEILPVPSAKDYAFRVGPNVIERSENGKIIFSAGITGILKLTEHSVEIAEVLIIQHDVGPETGNLHSSKDIIIGGNVLAGFTVECGGTLSIRGSIEDAVKILCKGDLFVKQGIFGERSDVVVKGKAQIGFLQNARLHVEGNCAVDKFIYNSRVFCGNRLTVEGKGVDGDRHGCVLGGEVTAMEFMELASAGCDNEITKLYCGVDPETLRIISAMKDKIASDSRKAANVRTSIGIDLSADDAQNKLKCLGSEEKLRIKELLIELKNLSNSQKYYLEKLPLLESKAVSIHLETCKIHIKKNIVPDVIFQIGREIGLLNQAISGVTLSFNSTDGVIIRSLDKAEPHIKKVGEMEQERPS